MNVTHRYFPSADIEPAVTQSSNRHDTHEEANIDMCTHTQTHTHTHTHTHRNVNGH